jgi:hypothetical protein
VSLALSVERRQAREQIDVQDFGCFAAGYTGRDRAAIDRHIRELEEHGVPPPPRVPFCFPVLPHLVSPGVTEIHVYGPTTSGEVEPVLIVLDGRPRFLAVGSDHTDRELEKVSIPLSKQLCQKVVSANAWAIDDLASWDDLELSSEVDRAPYQRALLGELLPFDDLVATIPAERRTERMVLFCGTVPLMEGLRMGQRFAGSLRNPSTGAALSIDYAVRVVEPIT